MRKYNNDKRNKQLGMPLGTALHRLRKNIIFEFARKCEMNICFQCKLEIKSVEEFSIEHKVPYLDSSNPVKLFFDIDNIAFSHLSCNCLAGRRLKCKCGSTRKYLEGCRCSKCTKANTEKVRKYRIKKKK